MSLSSMLPHFPLYANMVASGILIGIIYALIALGLTIVFGVMRVVNFAHGELVVVGMYLGYLMWSGLGLSPVLAMPLSACLMFGAGYLLQAGLVNRFIRRPHHVQVILFVGIALCITGVHMMVFGPEPRPISMPASFDVVELGPLQLDAVRLQGALSALALIGLLLAFLRYSDTGAAIRAAADNAIGAAAIGLRVNRVFAITAGIGLACAGAGTLIAPIFDTQPYLAADMTTMAFVIVIIGGLGSVMGALVGGVLIGISGVALLINPAMKSMISYGLLIAMLLVRPQGLFGKEAKMKKSMFKGSATALVFFLALSCLPLLADDAIVAIATLVLMFALYGQAWNLMMGYVGQLSLGHGLYIGLGAYAVALATGTHGWSPWLGILIGALISAAVAAVVAFVGFRCSVRGIYFTLLTIAVAEMMRMAFDNWSYVGGTAGYFLKAVPGQHPMLSLRGDSSFFYLAFLVLSALAFFASAALMRSRIGYFWRAIREDEDAARAIGVPALRLKILAVVASAVMTSIGGSFYALLSGSLFPDTMMGMRFSIEIIIAPIVGGLGTLFGPIVGALFIVPLGELTNQIAQQTGIFGLNLLIYGVLLLLVVCFMPDGLWPALVRGWLRLRLRATPIKAAAKIETATVKGMK